MQLALLLRPGLGAVIHRSGGVRNERWSLAGAGKHGGVRVIDYWDEPSETFYMLYAFRKNDREALTAQQLRVLSRLVREEFA